MKAIEINGKIRIYDNIPKTFEESRRNSPGSYHRLDSSVHYADGFRDLIEPTLSSNEYKGSLYYDSENDYFTYNVIQRTDEEQTEYEKEIESEKYLQRIETGKLRFAKIAADFRIDKMNGNITHEFHRLLEETLKPVRDEFVNGQFISAKEKLEEIGSSIITEVIYNNLLNSISGAIDEHY